MNSTIAPPTSPEIDPLSETVAVRNLPRLYPQFFPHKNSSAWIVRQRESNGLAKHLRWIGRTAYISRADFAAWVRSRTDPAPRSEAQLAASRKNVATARAKRTLTTVA